MSLSDQIARDHDVARTDVAVQVAAIVRVFQGVGQLAQQIDAMFRDDRAARFHQEVEAGAVDQLHDDVLFLQVGQAVLEGLDDIGMTQLGEDGAFARSIQADKTGLELGSLHLVEHLQAHGPASFLVAGPPDLGHAPLAHAAHQVKTPFDVDDRQVGPSAPAAEEVFQCIKKAHGYDPQLMFAIVDETAPVRCAGPCAARCGRRNRA